MRRILPMGGTGQVAGKRELTTTSYAILGLLALRPWTTYELAKQMERSLRNFWPRAESKLYEEPKNLVAHGLARATREHTGKRPRTVYSITPKGRRTLRSWLDTPGRGPVLEFDAILRVFFADQGTKDQLVANLRAIREWAEADRERGVGFLREYAEEGGPFPQRAHIIYLMTNFLMRNGEALLGWVRWAEREVEAWPDTATPTVDRAAFRRMLEEEATDVGRD